MSYNFVVKYKFSILIMKYTSMWFNVHVYVYTRMYIFNLFIFHFLNFPGLFEYLLLINYRYQNKMSNNQANYLWPTNWPTFFGSNSLEINTLRSVAYNDNCIAITVIIINIVNFIWNSVPFFIYYLYISIITWCLK